VDVFYGLGQRESQLTYNFKNLIGSGAFEPSDAGFSEFGTRIVERMNRVGMVVDVAHGGDRTILDACAASTRPVIISHGNCRALHPGYPRCATDEGSARWPDRRRHRHQFHQLHGQARRNRPRVDDVIDHIDHVEGSGRHRACRHRQAISGWRATITWRTATSCAGFLPPPTRYRVHAREAGGSRRPAALYRLAEGLLRRRYTDEQIKLVIGGNFRRVLSSVWR
jgi:membrane dipeptidase